MKTIGRLALILALLPGIARAAQCTSGQFVTNQTCTLPANTMGTKSFAQACKNADPTKCLTAANVNELNARLDALAQALYDARSGLIPPVCAADEANRWSGSAWSCIKVVTSPGTPSTAQALAFPGAEGGGALATGGRGGAVYEVTNLNDSGAGSLRACVQASGARTCVFRVSGVIKPVTNLTITNPYLTIAGQTAPGAGIAIHTQPGVSQLNGSLGQWIFDIQTHDVVIRHVKLWGDYLTGEGSGGNGGMGIVVHAPAYNVIVDHADIFWFTTEAIDVWADTGQSIRNVTIQRSLIGEGLRAPSNGQNTTALVAEAGYNPTLIRNVDLHHNVFTESGWRMPLMCSDSARFVNNVIYDWYRFALGFEKGTSSADVIGNHWIPGPSDKSTITEVLIGSYTTNTGGAAHNTYYFSGNKSDWSGPASGVAARNLLVAGNEADGGFASLVSASASYQGGASSVPDVKASSLTGWTRTTPLCTSDVTTGCTASPGSPGTSITVDAVSGVLAALTGAGGAGDSRRLNCDGSWTNARDSQATRIVGYVAAKTGGINTGAGYNYLSAGDAQDGVANEAGESGVAVPALGGGTACTDTDHDGMPDVWEVAQGLNANDASDRNGIKSGQPYTNLERYLAGN